MSVENKFVEYHYIVSGRPRKQCAEVIVERLVSLTVNGEIWLSFMCTPADLEALAIGFLYNEGFIHSIEEVVSVRVCQNGENIDVWLNHNVKKPSSWSRTSGCTGGITSADNKNEDSIVQRREIHEECRLSTDQINKLLGSLFESQDLYRKAGGVHTSALSNGQDILVVCEDIGRHNTLDKISGRYLLDKITLPQCILLTTGRISSEMMQKTYKLGALIVISSTSPSSLSIQMADRWGITLIGYARRNRFRLYTHPERIVFDSDKAKQY